jgi:hypothetical protein
MMAMSLLLGLVIEEGRIVNSVWQPSSCTQVFIYFLYSLGAADSLV